MITMKDIIKDGHPTLREKAVEVPLPPTEEDINTLNEMLQFLKNSQDEETAEKYGLRPGVGLAAPQINISKKIIAVCIQNFIEDANGTIRVEDTFEVGLFNPKIVSHSEEVIYLGTGEGCLSVDEDVEGYVPRYARITVEGFNLQGEKVRIRLKDYYGVVFQHEIDHLNGVMFYDHIDENQSKTLEYRQI